MPEQVEAVVIGGGQAGLAISYYLTQPGRTHVVLEQATQVAPAWRHGRWDSFTLVTPTGRSGCRNSPIRVIIQTGSCPVRTW